MHVDLTGGFFAECRDRPTIGGRKLLRSKSQHMFDLMDQDSGAKGIDITTQEGQDAIQALPEAKQVTVWSEATLNAMEDFQNALVVAMLVSWTLPQPVPHSIEEIENIEDEKAQAGVYKVRDALFPNWVQFITVPNFEPDPDPKALAASSAHSNGNSGASTTPSGTSTPTSSSGGTSSSTGSSSPAPTPNT